MRPRRLVGASGRPLNFTVRHFAAGAIAPMNQLTKIVCLGAIGVLVFDALASFASLLVGFSYAYATVGSVIIYGIVGYFSFLTGGIGACIRAAILVELVDVTLGWGISWLIGPGAFPAQQRTVGTISLSVIFVFIFAVVCALLGAGVGRALRGPRRQNA